MGVPPGATTTSPVQRMPPTHAPGKPGPDGSTTGPPALATPRPATWRTSTLPRKAVTSWFRAITSSGILLLGVPGQRSRTASSSGQPGRWGARRDKGWTSRCLCFHGAGTRREATALPEWPAGHGINTRSAGGRVSFRIAPIVFPGGREYPPSRRGTRLG